MARVDYKKFTDDSMLSPQEKEVLKYRQEGVPGRKIAEKLGIKIESVWVISHNIVLKCTGQYDSKKHYEYARKSFKKRMAESEDNQEKFKKQQKKYRGQNKDRIAKQQKEYYEKNKDRIAKQQKEYYEKNKDRIVKQQKEYYEKNKDRIVKQQKEYYEKNRNYNTSKVKEERNREIHKMFLCGETVQNISKKFGLSRQTIYNILKQKHTPEP